jgi:gamma-glutamyl phosphate reductase
VSEARLDRLSLTVEGISSITNDVRKVMALAYSIGQIIGGSTLKSSLTLCHSARHD